MLLKTKRLKKKKITFIILREKTAVPTLSRRSRFQVRPKLGISKESLKGLGKPNEGKEKRAEKTPPKSTTLTVLNTSKDAKRSREDRQPASPETNTIEDELLNSERYVIKFLFFKCGTFL